MNNVLTPTILNFLIISGVLISLLGVMWVIKLMQADRNTSYSPQQSKKVMLIFIFFVVILLLTALVSRWALLGGTSEGQAKEYAFPLIPDNPNYHQTLKQPLKIHGLELPIGTQVHLTEANNLNSVAEAHFQPDFAIANLPIAKINFYHDSHQKLDRILVQGKGVAQILGWRCDLTQPIDIKLNEHNQITTLEHCYLAAGNRIDDITLPTGSGLMSSNGTTYIDGKVAHDRWMLDVHTPFQLKKFHLTAGRLYFDAAQKFMGLNNSYLAKPVQFGDFLYPQGTQIDKELLLNQDGQSYWWFKHEAEQPIQSLHGTMIHHQDSVIQNDAAQIQYIMRHDPNLNIETHLKNMDEAISIEQRAASTL